MTDFQKVRKIRGGRVMPEKQVNTLLTFKKNITMLRFLVCIISLICLLSLSSCEKEFNEMTGNNFQVETPNSASDQTFPTVENGVLDVANNDMVEPIVNTPSTEPLYGSSANMLETLIWEDIKVEMFNQNGGPVLGVESRLNSTTGGGSHTCQAGASSNACFLLNVGPDTYEVFATQSGVSLNIQSVTLVNSESVHVVVSI